MTTDFTNLPEQVDRLIQGTTARPLRVAYVVSTFETGGLERCVANLVNQLDQRRFEPMVITLTQSGSAADWIERNDIPVLAIGKRPGNDLRAVKHLANMLKSEDIDVVHSHNWGTLLETVVARRRAGVPVHVHAEHGQELDALSASRWKRHLRRQAMRWGFRHVDVIVACANSVRARLVRQFSDLASRVLVIPNGVALNLSQGSPSTHKTISQENGNVAHRLRRDLGIPEEALVLGSLSRLAEVKDLPNAIRAVALLAARGRNVHLVLAGDGLERVRLEQTAAAGHVTQHVHFVGRQADVNGWLRMFDIYMNSSLSEAMCLGILEAMAAGTSVVATDVGDTSELIGGEEPCGLIVPPGDPVALADAIDRLMSDEPLRTTLGANGVRRHAAHYSVMRMTSDYAHLYLEKSGQDR